MLELNGINVISENERHGKPKNLFWPWMAGNVSLLALSYGAFFLGFGISFWQTTFAAVIGTVGSFALVAISSLAGKKSNAPTMTLSRAIFGVKGNIVPGFLSYLIFVGWETVLVSLATLATGTVFAEFGHINKDLAQVLGFLFSAGLTIFSGVFGFKVIMRIQRYLTLATIFLSLGYVLLTLDKINWSCLSENRGAIEILKANPKKIDWYYLSLNPNAYELLKSNQNLINWCNMSENPSVIDILKKNKSRINWYILSTNSAIFE